MIGVAPSHQSQLHFTCISLISGYWHGVEDEEAPSEQSVSVEKISQVRTPEAGPFPQKAHPCETCVSVLKDILHLAEERGTHPRQKPYTYGACGKQFFQCKPSPEAAL